MHWTAECSIMKKAPVNKIIPFSNVDGPGNRTAVFFQGCTFACLFCHNPETIHLCDHCGACVPACPENALHLEKSEVIWDPSCCVLCDTCIKTCRKHASPRVRWMTVDEVFHEILRTSAYIDGITVSGGECTLYFDFLQELFPKVHDLGKSCLIDSNGSLDFSRHPDLLNVCDGVMLDIKAVESAWCQELLGNSGAIPLNNLSYLLETGKLFEVRTVLFPEHPNENEQTIKAVAETIGSNCSYKLIRYRPFGVREEGKKVLGYQTTSSEEALRCLHIACSHGASKAFIV